MTHADLCSRHGYRGVRQRRTAMQDVQKAFVLTRPPLRARFADSARVDESARRARRATTRMSPNKAAVSEEVRRLRKDGETRTPLKNNRKGCPVAYVPM